MTRRAIVIRAFEPRDDESVRRIFEAAANGGDSIAPAPGAGDDVYRAYWFAPGAQVFVAECDGALAGTYMLRKNNPGLGDHVANAGYIVDPAFRGRGIAAAMCEDSLERARAAGFVAMQFNFVVSTNSTALRLWQRHGFEIVGRLPGAFRHARLGAVDAFVMFRRL